MKARFQVVGPAFLLALILAFSLVGSTLAAKRPPPRPPQFSIQITSPASGAVLQPGATIAVQASSGVVRVEYSIVSTSYSGLTENYLGNSTSAPFNFAWTGYASAIISGGGSYRLLARAYDSRNTLVTHEIPVVVPGTFNGPNPPLARNTVAAPAYDAILGGAQLVGQAQNSSVRALVEFSGAGEYAEFPLNAPVAGLYEITIAQYRLTGAKPPLEVQVNGQIAATSLAPARTVTDVNDFGREGQTTLVATLTVGTNRIRLTALDGNILSVSSVRIAQP